MKHLHPGFADDRAEIPGRANERMENAGRALDLIRRSDGILRVAQLLKLRAPFDKNSVAEIFVTDIKALTEEKQALIDKMLEMQRRFRTNEHEHGFSGKDYWASGEGPLVNYRREYTAMANRVVDLAHEIVGSSRF